MKFFTREWWRSGGDDGSVLASYESHLARIRDKLPEALLELYGSYTLHDGLLRGVEYSSASGALRLDLSGWDRDFKQELDYRLVFSRVEWFSQVVPPARPDDCSFGDLGYWEVDVKDGALEVAMLFASGAELVVRFGEFSFQVKDAPGQ